MTAKAVGYAENELGVHKVYEDAKQARLNLTTAREALTRKHHEKRDLADRITDREMVVASDERGKHPDMSAAGMEKHLKIALNGDGELRTARDNLRQMSYDIDTLEHEISNIEHDIKIAVARMTELGGYLNYLAAVKQATTPTQTKQTGEAE